MELDTILSDGPEAFQQRNQRSVAVLPKDTAPVSRLHHIRSNIRLQFWQSYAADNAQSHPAKVISLSNNIQHYIGPSARIENICVPSCGHRFVCSRRARCQRRVHHVGSSLW